jgi:excisionase family DNA binding protein
VIQEGAPAVRPGARRRFLNVAAAAEILGMSEVTLYRAINAGEFPAIKVRGRYVIPARSLDEMEDAAVTTGTVVDAAGWAESRGTAA